MFSPCDFQRPKEDFVGAHLPWGGELASSLPRSSLDHRTAPPIGLIGAGSFAAKEALAASLLCRAERAGWAIQVTHGWVLAALG